MTSNNPISHYETELEKLELIITRMENAELTLEEALAEYEQGITLIRHCREALKQAEQKIAILTQDQNNNDILTTFHESKQ